MKKTIYHLVLLFSIVLIFFSSCSKSEFEKDGDGMTADLSIREKVARLGFDTTGIVIKGENIIVEGDIVLTKSNINKTSPRQASTIDITNPGIYPITYSRHRNLKYFIPSTLSSWESAIETAFFIYSGLPNFNLRFDRTTNQNEADLVMQAGTYTFQNQNGVVGEAYFPSNGQIGIGIGINLYYSYFSETQKIYTLVHEIGHTIGFRHTGEYGSGVNKGVAFGGYTIPGTPDDDTNSVFNSGTGGASWTNFSLFDREALLTMYPRFGPAELATEPNGSFPLGTGSQIYANVSVPYWREGGLTYQWNVQGATITSNNGSSIVATVTDPNSAGVYCTITNAHGESTTVSRSFGSIAID